MPSRAMRIVSQPKFICSPRQCTHFHLLPTGQHFIEFYRIIRLNENSTIIKILCEAATTYSMYDWLCQRECIESSRRCDLFSVLVLLFAAGALVFFVFTSCDRILSSHWSIVDGVTSPHLWVRSTNIPWDICYRLRHSRFEWSNFQRSLLIDDCVIFVHNIF